MGHRKYYIYSRIANYLLYNLLLYYRTISFTAWIDAVIVIVFIRHRHSLLCGKREEEEDPVSKHHI